MPDDLLHPTPGIRTPADLTLATTVRDHARWESGSRADKVAFRDEYLALVTAVNGVAAVAQDDAHAVEVQYVCTLEGYLRWSEDGYDERSLVTAIGSDYPALALECPGTHPSPNRDAVYSRLAALQDSLPATPDNG